MGEKEAFERPHSHYDPPISPSVRKNFRLSPEEKRCKRVQSRLSALNFVLFLNHVVSRIFA
jgi:hypothetical protein